MPVHFRNRKGDHTQHCKSDSRPHVTAGQKTPKGKIYRGRKSRPHNGQRKPRSPQLPPDARPLANLSIDSSTSIADKLDRIKAVHAQWKLEDLEGSLEGDELVARQKQRCRDIGKIVFGFLLQEAQVDAIYTLMYEKRDLLLLARTGFGKSLIFQLLPFMLDPTGVVIILMPLKLLQEEQNAMINQISNGRAIALTGENNQKATQQSIATENYTHVFTSPEIALSKKFKANVLDNPSFAKRISLLAIDEIHLVEEWGKSFRPLYAEIDKVRKRIPHDVPLLGVSATLTKDKRLRVVDKAGFREDYKLMQTTLDRPEIQQIHRFMQHSKSSYWDLQFVLPPIALAANQIQKTIIFVNTVAEVGAIVDVIRGWMTQLGYPEASHQWVRPYHSTMSDWDKAIIAKAFKTPGSDNTECIILVATDAYGMGIDNPDIKLVIQWDLPMSFDAMIQRMGRGARKRGEKAAFVLLTPKWTQVKDVEEVNQRLAQRTEAANVNSQLSDSNRPKKAARPSPLSQHVEANDVSDLESVADLEVDEFYDPATTQLFDILTTEAEQEFQARRSKKRTSKSDAEKRAKLPDEIFDYIHAAKCRRLFTLAWYDDETYAPSDDGLTKALPTLCCNGSSCKSKDPEWLQRTPFLNAVDVRYTESDREWIAFRTAELQKWRKAKSKDFWLEQGVEDEMPENLLMADECLIALAKSGDSLLDASKVREFLRLWHGVDEYTEDILACIRRSSSHGDNPPSKADRKEALLAARASKKAKGMDDPAVAKAARITALRDQWLIKRNKITPALKARMKKAQDVEKKEKAKEDKKREKSQVNEVRRLALSNSHIGSFQEVLSDPPTGPTTNRDTSNNQMLTPEAFENLHAMQSTRLQGLSKKREIADQRASMLQKNRLQRKSNTSGESSGSAKRPQSLTPLPIPMELIRPGKRRVKITANAVESTPSKRMRAA